MHRLRVVLLVLVALGLVVASIAAPALGASPSIHLSPSQGPPITKVSVTGSGFGSSESVTIKFGSTTVGTTTTTAGGLFAKSVNVPTTATPGAHVVKATGQTSGLSATAVFIVTTAWAQFHFSGTKMGYNPFENVITTSNVSSLTQQWSASIGSPNNGELLSSPAVVNGTLYVGGGDGFLHAFSLSTHALKWEGSTGVAYYSSPAVYQHTIYVGGSSLYSFPATCSNPCSPLWTGQTGVGFVNGSPTIAGGTLYLGTNAAGLLAFDPAGCGSSSCAPLWSGTTNANSEGSPAVADGKVFIETAAISGHTLYAFDAAGVTNCSGTPKTCTPLWTANTAGSIDFRSSPVVSGGVVYVNDTTYGLYAFNDSNGQRLWKANGGAAFSTPAVAIGEVYALLGNSLKAYDAAGVTNCSGTPKVCTPLWSGTNVINDTSPVVAGGVVFIGSGGTGVYGYNAGGCGGLSCVPLWTARVTGRLAQGSPAVSDGRVYVASSGTYKVYAYG